MDAEASALGTKRCYWHIDDSEDAPPLELRLWETLYFFPAEKKRVKAKARRRLKGADDRAGGSDDETKYSAKKGKGKGTVLPARGVGYVTSSSGSESDVSSLASARSSDMDISDLSDTEHWQLDDADTVVDQRRRYFLEDKTITCRMCGQPGHMERDCNNTHMHLCSTCGEIGHNFRTCPFGWCTRCGSAGHSAKDCKARMECLRCGSRGHELTRCQELWRMYHSTTDGAALVTAAPTNPRPMCCICGKTGHFYYQCMRSTGDMASPFPRHYQTTEGVLPLLRRSYGYGPTHLATDGEDAVHGRGHAPRQVQYGLYGDGLLPSPATPSPGAGRHHSGYPAPLSAGNSPYHTPKADWRDYVEDSRSREGSRERDDWRGRQQRRDQDDDRRSHYGGRKRW